MANLPLPIVCTPEVLLANIPCLVCGRSKHELLAAIDAFLCEAVLSPSCDGSALVALAQPYLNVMSERQLVGATTYLWLRFLVEESPVDTGQNAMSIAVSPFLAQSQLEQLAMELWVLFKLSGSDAPLDASALINAGRCLCLSMKELLAIRLYLTGQFVGNFVSVDLDPSALIEALEENIGSVTTSALEATIPWVLCQLYDAAVTRLPN